MKLANECHPPLLSILPITAILVLLAISRAELLDFLW